MTSSLKPEDIQTTPVEEDKQEHPAFLDGKGKLWDGAGKRWIPIKQAERPARGLERVTKTFPSGNRCVDPLSCAKCFLSFLCTNPSFRAYFRCDVIGLLYRDFSNFSYGDAFTLTLSP